MASRKHVLVSFVVFSLFLWGLTNCDYPEQRLHNIQFRDYVKEVRPAITPVTITNVTVDLFFVAVNNYDFERRVLTAMTWLSMEWEDSRLAWHENTFFYNEYIKSMHLSPSKIWVPDIVLSNSIEPFAPQFPPRLQAHVLDIGMVHMVIPSVLKTQCTPTNVTNVVTCTYKLMSWTYNGHEIKLSAGHDGMLLDEYSPTPGLAVIGTRSKVNSRYYSCCPEPYYDIKFSIDIELVEKN